MYVVVVSIFHIYIYIMQIVWLVGWLKTTINQSKKKSREEEEGEKTQ